MTDDYSARCDRCANRLSTPEIVSDEFYRGFFIRKHFYTSASDTFYVVCARPAEGDNDITRKLVSYISSRLYEPMYIDCMCHPHPYVVAIGEQDPVILEDGEMALKAAIDVFHRNL